MRKMVQRYNGRRLNHTGELKGGILIFLCLTGVFALIYTKEVFEKIANGPPLVDFKPVIHSVKDKNTFSSVVNAPFEPRKP
jgi:hypothetical protein